MRVGSGDRILVNERKVRESVALCSDSDRPFAEQAGYHRIADRPGRSIARAAVARKLLTLGCYGRRR